MLVIVLVLVLVAFALLVLALLNSAMVWAWLSVLASLVAAVLLAVDWWRRRRAARAADELDQDDLDEDEPVPAGLGAPRAVEPAGAGLAGGGPGVGESDEFGDDANGDAEPDEEQTDAADVLAVSESDAEVRVVDERPRYHLASCAWLAGRQTLGLPVREARELGFTPCARCTPDRRLAAAQRRASAT